MNYEVRGYVERTQSLTRVNDLLHTIRSGGGQHMREHEECEARLDAIVAFDFRQARAGDDVAQARVAHYRAENHRSRVRGMQPIVAEPAEIIKASSALPEDPRDAVLAAMRAGRNH